MTTHWINLALRSFVTFDWKSLANRGKWGGFRSAATRSSTGSTYFTTAVQLAAVSETRTIVFLRNSKDVHVLFLDISPLHRSIVMRALPETLLHDRLVTLSMATWPQPMYATNSPSPARHSLLDSGCQARLAMQHRLLSGRLARRNFLTPAQP
jgi:hypothetical protein